MFNSMRCLAFRHVQNVLCAMLLNQAHKQDVRQNVVIVLLHLAKMACS